MDLPRLDAFTKYWAVNPPVHISVAAYVGWGKSKGSAQDKGDLDMLLASAPVKEFNPHG